MANHSIIAKNLIVGLSGPSSSGKTTLARLLRSVFTIPASPETNHNAITLFILHQDDFYKTDAEIPFITTPQTQRRLQDWDCAEAVNLPHLEETLRFVRTNGHLPVDLESKEDQNEVGVVGVGEVEIEGYRREMTAWLSRLGEQQQQQHYHIRICVLDGFLLYPDPTRHKNEYNEDSSNNNSSSSSSNAFSSISSLLDLKLFLRATHSQTNLRRCAREGYVTLEGFWHDPPGYVEEVVWPNYVREHAWMFEGGNVDAGEVRSDEVEVRQGIRVAPGKGEVDMAGLLAWAVGVVGEFSTGSWAGETDP